MPAKKRLTKVREDEPFAVVNSTAGDYKETALKYLKKSQEEKPRTERRRLYLNHAIGDALDAARLYEKEGRFGPAEKMYGLARESGEAFSKEFKPGRSASSKYLYNQATRNAERADYGSRRSHDNRLITLGNYEGRTGHRILSRRLAGVPSTLEVASSGVATIVGIFGGIFFLSNNITGNVIGSNTSGSNLIGVALLLVGIVGAFFYFRARK